MAGSEESTPILDAPRRPLPILLFLTATVAWMIGAFLLAGPFVERFITAAAFDLPRRGLESLTCPLVISENREHQISVVVDNVQRGSVAYSLRFDVLPSGESSGYQPLCEEQINIRAGGSGEAVCAFTSDDLPESRGRGWNLLVAVDLTWSPRGGYTSYAGYCFLRTPGLLAQDLLIVGLVSLVALALVGWGGYLWRGRGIAARLLTLLGCALILLELIVFHGFAWYGIGGGSVLVVAAWVMPIIEWAAICRWRTKAGNVGDDTSWYLWGRRVAGSSGILVAVLGVIVAYQLIQSTPIAGPLSARPRLVVGDFTPAVLFTSGQSDITPGNYAFIEAVTNDRDVGECGFGLYEGSDYEYFDGQLRIHLQWFGEPMEVDQALPLLGYFGSTHYPSESQNSGYEGSIRPIQQLPFEWQLSRASLAHTPSNPDFSYPEHIIFIIHSIREDGTIVVEALNRTALLAPTERWVITNEY